jgi:competence protein ComEC
VLRFRRVTRIAALVISHSDADHVAGAATLLLQRDLTVGALYVNPDATQDSASFRDLRSAVDWAIQSDRGLQVLQLVAMDAPLPLPEPLPDVTVLAPSPADWLGGVGGRALDGKLIDSNGASAICRISERQGVSALLMGDLDGPGLGRLLESGRNLRSDVLVFPHHGGLPGGADPTVFASLVARAVSPRVIAFSIGRGRYSTPRPEIIDGLRAVTDAHIACTELSTHCAAEVPPEDPPHLGGRVAYGRPRRSCCAGSLDIRLDDLDALKPSLQEHRSFVVAAAPTALCMAKTVQVER